MKNNPQNPVGRRAVDVSARRPRARVRVLLAAAALAATVGSASAAIAIRALANNMYVTAANSTTSLIANSSTSSGTAQQFDVIDLGNGNIGLRAHSDSLYVTTENGGSSPLIANRTSIQGWETFQEVQVSGGVALKAAANGMYVCADNAGASALIANRTSVGTWETFVFETPQTGVPTSPVAIRALANNMYVTAANSTTSLIANSSTSSGAAQIFDVIDLGNGNIGFRAHSDNLYVTAENGGASPLIANRTAIQGWETFQMVSVSGGVAFKAAANGDYVCADNAGASALIANRTSVGTWETFVFETPQSSTTPPPAPSYNPLPGTYTAPVTVSIADAASSATIYYTLDGSTPTTSSPQYTSPVTISSTATLNSIAVTSSGQSSVTTGTYTINTTTTVDFGPNVVILDPSMSASSVQSAVDNVFSQQETGQYGTNRYAILFKPGTYSANVRVGFFTQVLGLGASPNDVVINGAVQADAQWFNGNATQNFWRGAENLTVVPSNGTMMWAVSQACPVRRLHVKGNMVLDDNGGWSSGGFLGDTVIDGQINSGTQQQWLSRNSQWNTWSGSNWNMVFVGDVNPPASTWPSPANTVVTQTPVVREKPFLTIDSSGNYSVFVPALGSNTQGTTWSGGAAAGTSIPISKFYIAKSGTDTAASINAALSQGLNLLLTPGVYSLTDTIRVTNPNTVVLGLGIATLLAQNGVTAMSVADVDGVTIAGILFDAGSTSSPVLLQVGPSGSSASHAANPTYLGDLFFRIGGSAVGKAAVSLQINSSDVIGDDFWIWRADHSYGVGWNTNTAANGIVVNGANVTIYGLAVEHYQQYQTLWNGNGGRVYFYQSEAPYDVPNQSSWMAGSENGYASYKVADTVTTHQAYGVGVYCYFSANSSVKLNNAIEIPQSGLNGAMFHNMTTVSIGGVGEITHVIDGWGSAANSSNSVVRLAK